MQNQYTTHIYGVISVLIGLFSIYTSGWNFSDRLFWLSLILIILTLSFIYILNNFLLIIDKKTEEISANISTVESLKYELKSAHQEIESFKNITSFLASEKFSTPAKRKTNK